MAHFYEKYDSQIIDKDAEYEKLVTIFEREEGYYYGQYGSITLKNYLNPYFLKTDFCRNSFNIDEPIELIRKGDSHFYDYSEFIASSFYQMMKQSKIHKIDSKIESNFSRMLKIIKTDLVYLDLKMELIKTKFGDTFIIIPKDELLENAVETANKDNIKQFLIEYRYRKNEGNIEKKESILKSISTYIEGITKSKDRDLSFKRLYDDVNFLFNNLDLRHNNEKPNVNDMRFYKTTLHCREEWLDKLFDMCLYTIVSTNESNIHGEIEQLKKDVDKTQNDE